MDRVTGEASFAVFVVEGCFDKRENVPFTRRNLLQRFLGEIDLKIMKKIVADHVVVGIGESGGFRAAVANMALPTSFADEPRRVGASL